MKTFFFTICLLLTLVATAQPGKDVFFDGSKYVGKQFSDFKFESDGYKLSNSDLTGKIVFVNFWFIGCAPCRAEMEGLNQLYEKLKGNKDFMFVSISFDPEIEIKEFKAQNKIEYKIYHVDRQECYRLNFNSGFPTSFVIDKKGVIKYCKIGSIIDSKKASKMVMKEIYPNIVTEL